MKFKSPWISCLSLLVLAACSANPATTAPASSEGRVERVAPEAPAPRGFAWALSDVKATKRNHHTTFLVETKAGPFLYVFGGCNGNTLNNGAERIDIREDGSLGAWQVVRPLPTARGGHTGGVVAGNVIVVAGGMGAAGVQDTSSYAAVGVDGSLGEWKDGGTVGHPRMHPGAIVRGDTVYVMGGFQNRDVWSDIVRASVLPDGSLSPWTAAGTLLGPRTHFSVSTVDDYVFIVGGLDRSPYGSPPGLTEVARGRVLEDGSLGDWTLMPPLPVDIATHASFVRDGFLYAVGGIHMVPTPGHEKRVWRAAISADRTLGAWEEAAPLPVARGHVHQLPQWGDHVYSVSGAVDFGLGSTDTVSIGTFGQ